MSNFKFNQFFSLKLLLFIARALILKHFLRFFWILPCFGINVLDGFSAIMAFSVLRNKSLLLYNTRWFKIPNYFYSGLIIRLNLTPLIINIFSFALRSLHFCCFVTKNLCSYYLEVCNFRRNTYRKFRQHDAIVFDQFKNTSLFFKFFPAFCFSHNRVTCFVDKKAAAI